LSSLLTVHVQEITADYSEQPVRQCNVAYSLAVDKLYAYIVQYLQTYLIALGLRMQSQYRAMQ